MDKKNVKVEQDYFMKVCTCFIPEPRMKNSENGISRYCAKCSKTII